MQNCTWHSARNFEAAKTTLNQQIHNLTSGEMSLAELPSKIKSTERQTLPLYLMPSLRYLGFNPLDQRCGRFFPRTNLHRRRLGNRELDDALGLTEVAAGLFQDSRAGKNGRHGLTGLFRQSTFGRLGGYEDVNDADRLGRDPAMRWIVGGPAPS